MRVVNWVQGCNLRTLFSVLGRYVDLGKCHSGKSEGLSKWWMQINSEKNKQWDEDCKIGISPNKKNVFFTNMYTIIPVKFLDSRSIRS